MASSVLDRLLAKLTAMAAAEEQVSKAESTPAAPPQPSRRRSRSAKAASPEPPVRLPIEPPPGITAAEWREARRNVEAGSSPCLVRLPEPSDEAIARELAHWARLRQVRCR
jgi:hypothetical protein